LTVKFKVALQKFIRNTGLDPIIPDFLDLFLRN
jgi:hypothetical protein